jgi:hypothetical protein
VGGNGGRGGYEFSLGVGGSGGNGGCDELSVIFLGAGRGGGTFPALLFRPREGIPRPTELGEPTGVEGFELTLAAPVLIGKLRDEVLVSRADSG